MIKMSGSGVPAHPYKPATAAPVVRSPRVLGRNLPSSLFIRWSVSTLSAISCFSQFLCCFRLYSIILRWFALASNGVP